MYMKNTKSINIYMGIIGEAYVDKETAYGVLLAAKKNILDVQAIIKFGNDLSRPLSQAMSKANDAIDKAVTVYNKLKDAINDKPKDGIIYKKLIALLADLNENDFDNDFSNGGNIYTARENLAFAENLEAQRLEILAKANELLEANRLNAVVRCKEFNIAREIFESMIPDASISPEDLSDTLEDEYMRALNHIQSNISYITSSSDTIIDVSREVTDKIEKILTGADEEQQIVNDTNYEYWYVGNTIPTDSKLILALGFTVENEDIYKDDDGNITYQSLNLIYNSDFGVDGPLKANHWFHLPKDLARDGQLIAGIDGGKVSQKNWFIAVPTTVKNYKGEDKELLPCRPTAETEHTDGLHDHNVEIYSDDNNLGYTKEDNIHLTINNVEYVIWKLDSTEFNAQRLNVYMNIGTEQAEEATSSISDYRYLYIGSEKPTSNSKPYKGKEANNDLYHGWNRLQESEQSFDLTVKDREGDISKIFYVAIPNEFIIVSNGKNMLENDEESPFTLVYENLVIVGHEYDVYITGNEEASFKYDIISKENYNPEIHDDPDPENPEEPDDDTVHVTSIEIIDAPVYLLPGETYELKANVIPDNATNKNGNWNSEDSNIINIETENIDGIIKGHATANNVGQSKLTVISEDDNNISLNINVKVTETITYNDNMKYWYIGNENPRYVDNIVTDNNLPGWHEIGETLEEFTLDTTGGKSNRIYLSNGNPVIGYYVIIPNELNILDSNEDDGTYLFNEIQCNIAGYKAFKYNSQDEIWTVKGIIIKNNGDNDHNDHNNDQEYYWYVGAENSSSISNIQTNNTIAGWHNIGSSLSGFEIDTNHRENRIIVSTSENGIIGYYVIIPNELSIYDADNSNGLYMFIDVPCDIPGYKAYKSNSENAIWEVKGIIIR